jgi:hypothetical protein
LKIIRIVVVIEFKFQLLAASKFFLIGHDSILAQARTLRSIIGAKSGPLPNVLLSLLSSY